MIATAVIAVLTAVAAVWSWDIHRHRDRTGEPTSWTLAIIAGITGTVIVAALAFCVVFTAHAIGAGIRWATP